MDGEYRITVDSVADSYYDIQVVQQGIKLEKDKMYRLGTMLMRHLTRIECRVGMPEEPWTTF